MRYQTFSFVLSSLFSRSTSGIGHRVQYFFGLATNTLNVRNNNNNNDNSLVAIHRAVRSAPLLILKFPCMETFKIVKCATALGVEVWIPRYVANQHRKSNGYEFVLFQPNSGS